MPVTDVNCGTLRWQPLPRNCGLRTTTHVHRYIRLLEITIIKKRLKIDVRFHTILQILSRIISEQTQLNKQD